MTSQLTFIPAVVAPVRVFRFLWISKQGAKLRTFSDVQSFSSYVHEVRHLCGFDTVEFRTPLLAIGVLP